MLPRPRLTANNQTAIAKATDPANMRVRSQFSSSQTEDRVAAVDRIYQEGGYWFLSWAKQYYRRWTGEPLSWDEPFLEEFCLLWGTFQFETVVAEKSAQIGFTEICIALAAFSLAALKIPVGFGLEQASKLRDIVAPRVQPAFDYIQPIQQIRRDRKEATGREDIDSKDRKITVGGVEVTFFHVSTAASKKANDSERQASSSTSSFTAWLILADEIELWTQKALDIARQRQNACTMLTKPFRAGSTPGHEGGIVDSLVKNSGNIFQWQITCPHCRTVQFLDAFGNLLKPVLVEDEDELEERYLDITGKPLDWFSKNNSNNQSAIETAYIGCQECGEELDRHTLDSGTFVCRNTGVKMRDLIDNVISANRMVYAPAAIRLPRLASHLFNPSTAIRRLNDTSNPADEIQQGLGKPASLGGGRISLSRLLKCVGSPLPPTAITPDLVTMGVDQGTANNWVQVHKWYYQESHEDPEIQWRSAHKEVVYFGDVPKFERLDELVEKYGIDWIGMDFKPEIQMATDYARAHMPFKSQKGQVLLFHQVILKGENFKRVERNVQGDKVSVYALHHTFGLDAVRDRIYRKLAHYPKGLTYTPGDGGFISHYLVSDRLPDNRWVQLPGTRDDYFHSDNFSEMAALVHHYEPRPKKVMFTTIRRM